MRRFCLALFVLSLLPAGSLAAGRSAALPAAITEPVLGMELVLIPAGHFDMGSVGDRGYDFERPAHRVAVPAFYLGRYEVTFAQYDQFCRDTKRPLPNDEGWGRGQQPALNLRWEDAVDLAAWLTSRSGHRFRLPTEAEWEYAARAGRNSEYWWGNQAGTNNANCQGCGSPWHNRPAPVGSFAPNPFGLYDMNGNVYEWCLDTRHDNYRGAPSDATAWLWGATPDQRILRGGSFLLPAFDSRSRARSWDLASRATREYGVRLVMEP